MHLTGNVVQVHGAFLKLHYDQQVIVAIGASISSRPAAEEDDALRIPPLDDAPDDFPERRVAFQEFLSRHAVASSISFLSAAISSRMRAAFSNSSFLRHVEQAGV